MDRVCYLTKAILRNFRSIKEVHLNNIGDVTILIGANESGKTNILHALKWSSTDDPLGDNKPVAETIGDDEVIAELYFKILDMNKFLDKIIKKLKNLYNINEVDLNTEILSAKYIKLLKKADGTRLITVLDKNLNEIKNILDETTFEEIFDEYIAESINNVLKASIKEILTEHNIQDPSVIEGGINSITSHQIVSDISKILFEKIRNFVKNSNSDHDDGRKNKLNYNVLINELRQQIPNKSATFNISGKQININSINLFDRVKQKLMNIEIFDDKVIIQNIILNLLPKFIYLDGEMELKGEIKKNGTWFRTLVESEEYIINYRLFSILFGEDYLKEFDRKNITQQKQELQNRLDEFSNKLIKLWKQEKVLFDVNVAENTISLYIVDINESVTNRLKVILPESRSRGFKWYLSYLITLEYLKKKGNVILLLDDPAVFLHERGQKDFLETVDEVSKFNQIFYTTHLIALFDERKMERILLVKTDRNKNTRVCKPWKSEEKLMISPICHALGIDKLIFENTEEILFVEGISDKFILEGLRNASEVIPPDVVVHPLGGGNKLEDNKIREKIELLSCLVKHKGNINYCFVLDGDRRELYGKNKNEKLEIYYFGDENQEIEDLIDREFYLNCVMECYQSIFIHDASKLQKLKNSVENLGNLSNDQKGITKKLSDIFKKNNLGTFSKVDVAITIKRKLDSGEADEADFSKITEVLNKIYSNKK